MPEDKTPPPKSYGNISEHHWSKTRGARNSEAIDYYRERSKAPGVAEGGASRNHYCMECDGVIPWDEFAGKPCPHCGAPTDGNARRYFNWVEIDRAPETDRTATLLAVGIVAVALVIVAAVIALILS